MTYRYTIRVHPCRLSRGMDRLNITLDAEQGAKLARWADRMHVQPGTLARSLLSSALDEADPDARNVVERSRLLRARVQARSNDVVTGRAVLGEGAPDSDNCTS